VSEYLDLVKLLPAFLLALLIFGFAPGFILRLLLLLYPRDDARRAELLGELYAMSRVKRPMWVAEQIETALFEGPQRRVRARRARQAVEEAAKAQAAKAAEEAELAVARKEAAFLAATQAAKRAAKQELTRAAEDAKREEALDLRTPEQRVASELGAEVLAIINSDDDEGWVTIRMRADTLDGKPIETASNTGSRL
jgi:Mg-chelatase subunit ChlI